MHVTTKEVDDQGVHILTSTVEADGPFELASEHAALDAKVIAVRRTSSGGVVVQTALTIAEPKAATPAAPEPATPTPTAAEQAEEYLKSNGLSAAEAASAVERFGPAKILQRKEQALNEELDALLKK